MGGKDACEMIVSELRPSVERPGRARRKLQHAHVRRVWFQDISPTLQDWLLGP